MFQAWVCHLSRNEKHLITVGFWRARLLTAPPDVDVKVAFDDCAALQGLSSIHRVNCFRFADLIAQSVTCATKHTAGGREREGEEERESECQGQITATHTDSKQANASKP